jgi:hypothetical protein
MKHPLIVYSLSNEIYQYGYHLFIWNIQYQCVHHPVGAGLAEFYRIIKKFL